MTGSDKTRTRARHNTVPVSCVILGGQGGVQSVSQINGCAYCIDLHARDLLKVGVAVEKLMLVSAWREAGGLFSDQERAALRWAETVRWFRRPPYPMPTIRQRRRNSKER